MILSLLSSTFNTNENLFKNISLNSQYFKEQQLINFKDEVSQPHKCLNEIFAKTRHVPMITSALHAMGMVPKPVTKGNEFTVPDFIEKIIKYSELISDNKKTSADNSISSPLSKVFRKSHNVANQKIATIDQAMQSTWIMPHLVQPWAQNVLRV